MSDYNSFNTINNKARFLVHPVIACKWVEISKCISFKKLTTIEAI